MALHFAARTRRLEPFLAMEVMERAFAMERAGEHVLHLEVGEPDFAPPRAAVEACVAALQAGETRYTDSRGLAELREEIAADYQRRFGAAVEPERVLVASGTSAAMLLVFHLLVEPGDEVVLGTPHYPCYPNFIRACGGVPVLVPTDPALGYRLDPEAVRSSLSDRTRVILVSSPANPTGAIQSPTRSTTDSSTTTRGSRPRCRSATRPSCSTASPSATP
jgi:aspartate/methionine/tyrosine aminotransferase